LDGNASNQSHFLLMKGLPRVANLLQLEASDYVVLTDAKAAGLLALCRLIRVLTAWEEPQTPQMQGGLLRTAVGTQLAQMALGRLPLVAVRIGALYALGYLIRNQGTALGEVRVGDELQPGVTRALTVATSAAVSPEEAQGCVFLLQCYFWNNVNAQLEFVSHWSDSSHLMAQLLRPALHEDHFALALVIVRLFQSNASAQLTAIEHVKPLMPLLLSLDMTSKSPAAQLGQIGRLRILYAVCRENAEATTLFFGAEPNNYIAKLVEAVISAHSDPHVAISSLVVLLGLFVCYYYYYDYDYYYYFIFF
jgi:hypothetical protein